MSFLQSILTEKQLATILFAMPFLALCAGWLVGLSLLALPERVAARREGGM